MGSELTHNSSRKISKGRYFPLGADLQKDGVNFAIYSQHAAEVYLLLFDRADGPATDIVSINNRTKFIWHCFVSGLKAGQLYGFKVKGDYDPAHGLRFNENKLLIDPYTKALTGKPVNKNNLLLGYDLTSPRTDLKIDERDNSAVVPKCIVVDNSFDWQGDTPPEIPLEKMFIYETHLKGFTAHKSSRVKCPGTYLGFREKIPYLKNLGINAVELLPVQDFYHEDFLVDKGLSNYWGYNTIGFFAPEYNYGTRSAPGCQVTDFKTLVRELHRAGIEIILDVVYNHTCEGHELGPTLHLKGIDNPTYYLLTGPDYEPGRHYVNITGCGNSLNLAHPSVIRLVLDSLRYWVEIVHVDGFRFDLASVLGRENGSFQKTSAFFDAISQDPVLCCVKLIAEPWDLATYQVGNFPIDWSEWNGKFRDTIRRFVRGDAGQVKDLGYRLTGSADLYGNDGRSAYNSINFVTCHDGFTLNDLVSYNRKHNEANLDDNRGGADENLSWNCGVEGPTDDQNINWMRKQLAKNFFCCLIFSLGTPMVQGGDEFMRTQKGNNNAYCQDNDLSWFDWDYAAKYSDVTEFFRRAVDFSKRYPLLQRRKFLFGRDFNGNKIEDICWFGAAGGGLNWNDFGSRTLCYQLDGSEDTSDGRDYLLFFILNSDSVLQPIKLPQLDGSKKWRRAVDTSLPAGQDFADPDQEVIIDPPSHYLANPRSIVVLIGK